ncbi:hypothetical protein V8G54_013556 [Vigna mungo]|uniref:25S rRNA (uridine-N(3))-methyltransferase BMT5-like domain-containing protein n=1 Tax=Vigna mungo TaxID=3915 RepID=A0AAQ3NTK7_VIGMU
MDYSSYQGVLLVGEGDFSFSLSLARTFGTAKNMVATTLDYKVFLAVIYAKASQNLKELGDLGCTILTQVNVMTMAQHPFLQHRKFDRIIYNFPHAGFSGRESDFSQIQLHKDLVRGFLQNAKLMLSSFGEIHITHKTSYPYNMWDIEYLANCEGLRLDGEVEFDKALYPGYENKRSGFVRTSSCRISRIHSLPLSQLHRHSPTSSAQGISIYNLKLSLPPPPPCDFRGRLMGRLMELIDTTLGKYNGDEATICIQLGKPGIQGRTGRWTTTTSALTNTNASNTTRVSGGSVKG